MRVPSTCATALSVVLFVPWVAAATARDSAALDPIARGQISAAVGRDVPDYHVATAAGSLLATNSAHRLHARFTPEGVRVGERWGLATQGVTCGSHHAAAEPVEPRADANRVEYRRGAVTEWYTNGPLGLQQGFTVQRRPQGCDAGELRVDLAFTGTAEPRWHGSTAAIDRHTYGGLAAMDATGRRLPVEVRHGSDARAFALVVSLQDALFPVLIDPVVQTQELVPGDAANAGVLGGQVAIDGDTALVSAHTSDIGANADQGAAYVFVRVGGVWSQQQKLTASDGAAGDAFGWSVAVQGNTAIIGAFNDTIGANAAQGSAYVFTRAANLWTQRTKLVAADGLANDQLGYSVALDSGTAILSSHGRRVGVNEDQGSAYVFTGSGASWSQQTILNATDGVGGDQFGLAVALSNDTAVIGAPLDSEGPQGQRGAAYVFIRTGPTTWAQQQKLQANDGQGADNFGNAVAVFNNTALIGAPAGDATPGGNQGAAYVFERVSVTWTQQAKLFASDAAGGDRFGYDVSLASGTAVVGADFHDAQGNADRGAVYVFARSGNDWTETAELLASDGAGNDHLGLSVAISGGVVVAGAPLANGERGAAYIFDAVGGLANGDDDNGTVDPDDDEQSLTAGAAVATAGNILVVGAPETGAGNTAAGRVFVYEVTNPFFNGGCGTPTVGESQLNLLAELTLSGQPAKNGKATLAVGDKFGGAVAISEDTNTIAIGIPGRNGGAGQVAVYRKPATGWIDWQSGDPTDNPSVLSPPVQAGTTPGGFGEAVALSNDGGLLIGAPLSDRNGNVDAGAVHLFRPTGGNYPAAPTQSMDGGASLEAGAQFGKAVGVRGQQLVAGAPFQNAGAMADVGAVHVFRSTSPGGVFASANVLSPPVPGIGDKFGSSVGVDDDTVVAGSPGSDTGAGVDSGAGFVFERNGAVLMPVATLLPENGAGQDAGTSISIAGEYVLMGSPEQPAGGRTLEGTSYLYQEPDLGWETASEQPFRGGSVSELRGENAKIGTGGLPGLAATARIPPKQGQAGQRFGSSVTLSQRGLVVGAPMRDDETDCTLPTVDEGAADSYVFERIFRNGLE